MVEINVGLTHSQKNSDKKNFWWVKNEAINFRIRIK
jgi:hypothetical protein